jgi:DNA-binding CsgD family transcriptional regulator
MRGSVTRATGPVVSFSMRCRPRHVPIPAGDDGALDPFEQALEWLADGVALLGADGRVVYANRSFRAITQRNDGIGTHDGKVEIAAAAARTKFERAVAAILHPRVGGAPGVGASDLAVAHSGSTVHYLLSVRPVVMSACAVDLAESQARVAVFVRDSLYRNTAAIRILCNVLQLTEAEALLAQALQAGVRLRDYARARGISINTIYAHLRNIKQKTGSHRMSELIRRLNDLQAVARSG